MSLQLNTIVGNAYEGECNVDPENTKKPGFACLWRKGIQAEVSNIVSCRIQCVKVLGEQFFNVYGNPGTQG